MVYGSAFEAAAGYGWHVGKSELDWEHFITAIDKSQAALAATYRVLEKAGVELIQSRAKF